MLLFFASRPKDSCASATWMNFAPNRCRLFVWLAFKNRLFTNEWRFRHGLQFGHLHALSAMPRKLRATCSSPASRFNLFGKTFYHFNRLGLKKYKISGLTTTMTKGDPRSSSPSSSHLEKEKRHDLPQRLGGPSRLLVALL